MDIKMSMGLYLIGKYMLCFTDYRYLIKKDSGNP